MMPLHRVKFDDFHLVTPEITRVEFAFFFLGELTTVGRPHLHLALWRSKTDCNIVTAIS